MTGRPMHNGVAVSRMRRIAERRRANVRADFGAQSGSILQREQKSEHSRNSGTRTYEA